MRIQIGNFRPNEEYDVTIDPNGKYVEPQSYKNIPCDDNEAKVIKIQLDIIPYMEVDDYIKLAISKLRLKGRLILIGKNLNEINRQYFMGNITDKEYNLIIADVKSLWSPAVIKNALLDHGLRIVLFRLDNFSYYLEATR